MCLSWVLGMYAVYTPELFSEARPQKVASSRRGSTTERESRSPKPAVRAKPGPDLVFGASWSESVRGRGACQPCHSWLVLCSSALASLWLRYVGNTNVYCLGTFQNTHFTQNLFPSFSPNFAISWIWIWDWTLHHPHWQKTTESDED